MRYSPLWLPFQKLSWGIVNTWYVECFYYPYLVIQFSICDFLLAKPHLSFSTPSFSKQHRYPKYSLLLLNPISKQYCVTLVAFSHYVRSWLLSDPNFHRCPWLVQNGVLFLVFTKIGYEIFSLAWNRRRALYKKCLFVIRKKHYSMLIQGSPTNGTFEWINPTSIGFPASLPSLYCSDLIKSCSTTWIRPMWSPTAMTSR